MALFNFTRRASVLSLFSFSLFCAIRVSVAELRPVRNSPDRGSDVEKSLSAAKSICC